MPDTRVPEADLKIQALDALVQKTSTKPADWQLEGFDLTRNLFFFYLLKERWDKYKVYKNGMGQWVVES